MYSPQIPTDESCTPEKNVMRQTRLAQPCTGSPNAGRRKAIAERLEAAFGAILSGDYARFDIPALAVRGSSIDRRALVVAV